MVEEFFLKGLIIGISIAAPVGPIGLLCIQRTLNYGPLSGLMSGLGAATADTFYGAVAAFGLASISSFLVGQQFWLALVGGIFLLYLGIKAFLAKPAEKAADSAHKGLFYDYTSTVLLTLSSPATILAFVAIFAGLGGGEGPASALLMTLGVASGSTLWWFILTGGIGFLRRKIDSAALLAVINKLAGLILIAFALYAFKRSFT